MSLLSAHKFMYIQGFPYNLLIDVVILCHSSYFIFNCKCNNCFLSVLLFFFLFFSRLFHITYSLLGAVFQNYASQPSLTPDDDVFKHLSLTYANNHAKMSRGVACKSATPQFEQGITNGNAWYPLTGGMQVRKTSHVFCCHMVSDLCLLILFSFGI